MRELKLSPAAFYALLGVHIGLIVGLVWLGIGRDWFAFWFGAAAAYLVGRIELRGAGE